MSNEKKITAEDIKDGRATITITFLPNLGRRVTLNMGELMQTFYMGESHDDILYRTVEAMLSLQTD